MAENEHTAENDALGIREADCGCCLIVDEVALRELVARVESDRHFEAEYDDAVAENERLRTTLAQVRELAEGTIPRREVSVESLLAALALPPAESCDECEGFMERHGYPPPLHTHVIPPGQSDGR